ncbi:hypothetical protein NIIDNTM18_10110 [Mycolicibacterium litorale]|uniref:Uncharacterized protein n=2 Tax=Mycolicibacterium litorale TaxID=758802 RepID=A0A6S6NWY1_9MYCO|nr:hypothetical protein NIIDNTM18_10110 [Mycolicibacterium litorale]
MIDHPIHPDAATVIEEMGGSAANFAARQLTRRIASSADLVLAMTLEHRDAVLDRAPQKLNRTFTIAEAARLASEFGAQTVADLAVLRGQLKASELFDVPDPIGQPREVFASIGTQIADLLLPILELCQRSGSLGRLS